MLILASTSMCVPKSRTLMAGVLTLLFPFTQTAAAQMLGLMSK
jgi:hypothetical protein